MSTQNQRSYPHAHTPHPIQGQFRSRVKRHLGSSYLPPSLHPSLPLPLISSPALIHLPLLASSLRSHLSLSLRLSEFRDDKKKLHPCLVNFAGLPEPEKNYNLAMAGETLKYVTCATLDLCVCVCVCVSAAHSVCVCVCVCV